LNDPNPNDSIIEEILRIPKMVGLIRRQAGPNATASDLEEVKDLMERETLSQMKVGRICK
jgi:hypothetical protein